MIGSLPAFGQLPRAALDMLSAHALLQECRRGAAIARRGESFQGVIAVVEGSVKLSLRRNAREEKIARILEPGECFGFAAMLLGRPCPVDVVALAPSAVATIPAAPILRLVENNAAFALALARTLAGRVLELIGELEASVQQTSLQRLACYLDSRAEPDAEAGKWRVSLPATKSTIAARLGVKKETMSRMLRELASRGVIRVAGPEIAILDRDGLARLGAMPG